MDSSKKVRVLLTLATIALWVIVLQNAKLIPALKREVVSVGNTVKIQGTVEVKNTVDINGSVAIDNPVDVNLSQVVGYDLVNSQNGMYIGVNSTKNTIIPIHWGEISISR